MNKKMNKRLAILKNRKFPVLVADEAVVVETLNEKEENQNSGFGVVDDHFEIFGDIEEFTI